MKKAFSVFNFAEWCVVIVSIIIVVTATQGVKSPYREIVQLLLNAFWFSVIQYRLSQRTGRQSNSFRSTRNAEYEAKYRRLLGMVGGDKQVCDSLISSYGVDRAIDDLIRDRQ